MQSEAGSRHSASLSTRDEQSENGVRTALREPGNIANDKGPGRPGPLKRIATIAYFSEVEIVPKFVESLVPTP